MIHDIDLVIELANSKVIRLAAVGVLEKKVLLVDADPQGNASSALGFEFNNNQKGLYDILSGSESIKNFIPKIYI